MMSFDLFQQFFSLSCQLSPENLHCDGEISPAEAQRKYVRLMKQWRALEAEAGRAVTEDELWGPQYAEYRDRQWKRSLDEYYELA